MPTPPHPLPFPWVDNKAAHKARMRRHKVEIVVMVSLTVTVLALAAYRAWERWGMVCY